MPRDHDLLWRINVSGLADLAMCGVLANRRDLLQIHAEDGRHCAYTDWDSFLHVLTAVADGTHGVGKADRRGGNVRRILTQAVSGDKARLQAFLVQNTPSCD